MDMFFSTFREFSAIPYTVEPPKVGCTIGVFSKLQLNEPPKVGFLSEVGCGVRLLKF